MCYGTEFTSRAILRWASENRVEWHYIDPGKRDYQEFRVWAGIMGKKETHYVPTQRTCDSV